MKDKERIDIVVEVLSKLIGEISDSALPNPKACALLDELDPVFLGERYESQKDVHEFSDR